MEVEKFNKIVIKLKPRFEEERKKRNNYRGGTNHKLSVEQILFLLLIYYRTYVNHIFIGMIAGIDDSNVGRNFKKIDYLLAEILNIDKLKKEKIALEENEILELIVDATEQESEKRNGSGYSGKKKRNTIKTQMIVDKKGKVKHISNSIPGNIHDKKLFDFTKIDIANNIKILGDLGYIGTDCDIPIKKKRNTKLTEKEKQLNYKFSQKRIIVEHVFAHLKKFNILKDRFRNNLKDYNRIFSIVAGIYNLKFE